MTDNEYLTELESRINRLISSIENKYKLLKEQSNNIVSLYEFNKDIDEIEALIERILFYKKQLARLKTVDVQEKDISQMTDEEISKEKHRRLLIDKATIEEQIKLIDKAIAEAKKEPFLHRLVNQLEMQRFYLTTDELNIKSKLRIYEEQPDLSDGEIDIYLTQNKEQIPFQGTIYLHGTPIEVGAIEYRGKVDNEWLGDIGYTIKEKHRGNNYAYKALKLISQVISAKGIEKVTITTYKENIPSVKTIEKFGGVLNNNSEDHILSYTCYIKPILEQSVKKQ